MSLRVVQRKLDQDELSEEEKRVLQAVKEVNPPAFEEPQTNVLWGSIGANSCHMALAEILLSILNSNRPDLTEERFVSILNGTQVSDYNAWFSKPCKKPEDSYPGQKGDLPRMTGAANYVRLAKDLEKEWRASIHADAHTGQVKF